MSILKEIQSQPAHIREIFMWALVVIVFSFVVFGWLQTTEKRVYAILNPGLVEQERAVAETEKQPPLFATIGESFSDLKKELGELFGVGNNIDVRQDTNQPEAEPQKLPITD